MSSIYTRIRTKGFIESLVVLLTIMIRKCYSLVIIGFLNMRGYRIAHSVSIMPSSDFFESKCGAISVGVRSRIRRNTRINAGFTGEIDIGRDVLIDDGTYIMAQQRITIGDHSQIAPHCFITDFNHAFADKRMPIVSQGYTTKPVVIEADVWIGTHSVILSGVTIGQGAIIGAGSVVTKSIPPYVIAAGNPARVIRKRP